MDFFESHWYTYFALPLLIVLARIVDVSIGTIKIIYITRGNRTITPFLGFFEVLIWLLAVTRIFENLDNWICYFAYSFGFALGSYIGIKIEEKLAIGVQIIRVITRRDATDLIHVLREMGFMVTSHMAEGSTGEVGILYSIVNRKNIGPIVEIIKKHNPKAFYTIEDIRYVSQEIHNVNPQVHARKFFSLRR
jgi:uncharacterized protein YebE (UPF0316 family)